MSSGCVPNKDKRTKIIKDAAVLLQRSYLILNEFAMGFKNSDEDPKALESAVNLVHQALGNEYPNRDRDDLNNGIGLNWLMEHYFSWEIILVLECSSSSVARTQYL